MPGPLRTSATCALAALLAGCAAAPPRPRVPVSVSAAAQPMVQPMVQPSAQSSVQSSAQSTAPGDYSRPTSGRLTFTFGQRQLDGDFAPTDEPQAFGIEFSRVTNGDALGFELGLQFADDRVRGARLSGGGTGNLELFQSEFYAGLRAQAGAGPLHPYLGAGATWVTSETRVSSGGLEARESSGDLGAYGHAGLLFEVSRSVHISVEGRMTFFTDHSIDGDRFEGDYSQVTIGVGATY